MGEGLKLTMDIYKRALAQYGASTGPHYRFGVDTTVAILSDPAHKDLWNRLVEFVGPESAALAQTRELLVHTQDIANDLRDKLEAQEAKYAKLVEAAKRHKHVGLCLPGYCDIASALHDLEVSGDTL